MLREEMNQKGAEEKIKRRETYTLFTHDIQRKLHIQSVQYSLEDVLERLEAFRVRLGMGGRSESSNVLNPSCLYEQVIIR